MKRPTRDALPTTNFTWLCCWRLLLLLYHFGGHNRVLQEAVCQKKKKNFFVPPFPWNERKRERERDCVIRWDCWMLSLDQFNFFWVPSSLGCCFIFFITWITGTIPHFYSLLPSWSLSLSSIYLLYLISWEMRRAVVMMTTTKYISKERDELFRVCYTKGRRRKGKEMNSKSKMTSICTLTDQYIVSCFYISPRETRFFSLNISSDSIFFRPPVLIRVVFLSDRDSHRRPNGVVPSVMSVLYVSCRSISPSQQSFLLSHTHDVCLLLSSSQLFREYRPSRRASCVWNMETRTSGARRDFSSFSAPFMRVAKRLPFFPIFLLPLSFLELIILVSGYVSSLTEKTAGRWKRDRTNNSETSLQTAFTFFLCVCCSSFSLWRERIVALEDK